MWSTSESVSQLVANNVAFSCPGNRAIFAASPTEDTRTYLQKFIDANKMVVAGGTAGACARTASAPLDRIKLLFQVQGVATSGLKGTEYAGLGQAFYKIYTEEGILAFWKGNLTNLIRIVPYSSAQLSANDFYKRVLADEKGDLTLVKRLTSGALAGMTATALTHPLDTIRLRLALPNHPYKGMVDAFVTVARVEGPMALLKGLPATLAGIAPYAATNFAAYDVAKTVVYKKLEIEQNWMTNMAIGAGTGTFAATVCYPLDTVRRRMQMSGSNYTSSFDCISKTFKVEGVRGFFKGWMANTLKVVPQNSIRFVTYEMMKTILGVQKAKTDT